MFNDAVQWPCRVNVRDIRPITHWLIIKWFNWAYPILKNSGLCGNLCVKKWNHHYMIVTMSDSARPATARSVPAAATKSQSQQTPVQTAVISLYLTFLQPYRLLHGTSADSCSTLEGGQAPASPPLPWRSGDPRSAGIAPGNCLKFYFAVCEF